MTMGVDRLKKFSRLNGDIRDIANVTLVAPAVDLARFAAVTLTVIGQKTFREGQRESAECEYKRDHEVDPRSRCLRRRRGASFVSLRGADVLWRFRRLRETKP
jgi:hypothetical protein